LAYADDINTEEENTDTTKKNIDTVLNTSREAGLEMNPEKTTYMLISRYKKAGQKHSIKTVTRSFEDEATFKYFGTT
jgi:hypothetical protein